MSSKASWPICGSSLVIRWWIWCAKVLQDLANAELEQQTVKAFQKQLQNLDDETRQSIAESFANQNQPVTVETGLELPQASQDDLRQTLQEANLLNGQVVNF